MNIVPVESLSDKELRLRFTGSPVHLAVIDNDMDALSQFDNATLHELHHSHSPLALAILLRRVGTVEWLVARGVDVAAEVGIFDRIS